MWLLDYISRIGKAQGFGIQSPWAYAFVRDVIMERLPYYGYDEIDVKKVKRSEKKRQMLYFRLRNYCHGSQFVVIPVTEFSIERYKNVISEIDKSSIICIEGIYNNEECRKNWESIKCEEMTGVTFDLYDLAIVFPRNEMYKQHYKLNF